MLDASRARREATTPCQAERACAMSAVAVIQYLVRSPPPRCDPNKFDRPPGQNARLMYVARQRNRPRRFDEEDQAQTAKDREKLSDQTPAATLGITPLQACSQFGRSYHEVWQAFVRGSVHGRPCIGHRDHFECWWASLHDLTALFAPAPASDPTEPLGVQRARAKADAIRARLGRAAQR